MLYKMVNTICAQGGIELRSNHSLRATELYNAGVLEKIIKERTGSIIRVPSNVHMRTNK